MSINSKYYEAEEKLELLCDSNKLDFTFRRDTHPMVFHFEPVCREDAQACIDMPDDKKDVKEIDPESSLDMIFDEELIIQTSNDFSIDDVLLSKLKSAAKKLHYLFLQLWFSERGVRWRIPERDPDAKPEESFDPDPNVDPFFDENDEDAESAAQE